MSSENKAPEGIALLSMYGDEDDEMEVFDEEGQNRQEDDFPPSGPDALAAKDDDVDYGHEKSQRQEEEGGMNDNSTPNKTFSYGTSSATATPQLFSPPQQLLQQQQLLVGSDFNYVQTRQRRMLIVDYGHEEGAMSPEAEDGEVLTTGRVMYGELLQTSEGESREKKLAGVSLISTPTTQATPPQPLEPVDQSVQDAISHAVNESESRMDEDVVMVSVEEQNAIDPMNKFLSLPPKDKCSEALQVRIKKFLRLKKTDGISFNSEVRNRKEYRNPDFLLHAVTYQAIDQIGSCFPKDVFDPHGYDKSDFYDEIEADMRREMERREQERKKSQKVDFTSSGVQPGIVVPTPKINLPTPGLNVTPASSEVTGRDGRQNKKSKWDKVDVDQESLTSIGAHAAAIISSAKAGSGYSAFAQQRRKEAEDKRPNDKRSERKS